MVTTDVAVVAVTAVVNMTVEVDVVTTGQVTVTVTTAFGNDVVTTGATNPAAAAVFTVAAGIVDEEVAEVSITDAAEAVVTVIAEEQAGSLAVA